MNPLPVIKKHIKAIEEAFSKIKGAETRGYAIWEVQGMQRRLGLPINPVPFRVCDELSVPEPVQASVAVEAVLSPAEGKSDCGAVSVAKSVVWQDEGEPGPGSMLPIVPEEPAIVGDLEGSGTFYPETVSLPVEMVGGWPERGEMEIMGLAPNRRHLTASLPDGRKVSVERTFGRLWKPGEKVICRLIRAGAAPLFRVV